MCKDGGEISKAHIPVCAFQCSAHRTSHSTEEKKTQQKKIYIFFFSTQHMRTSNVLTVHQKGEGVWVFFSVKDEGVRERGSV